MGNLISITLIGLVVLGVVWLMATLIGFIFPYLLGFFVAYMAYLVAEQVWRDRLKKRDNQPDQATPID